MARLRLVNTTRVNGNLAAHRASASEGEAASKLLESQGFELRGPKNGQYEGRCPFHEGPGPLESRKGVNFYMNKDSGLYTCHSASCGEKGNLQTLERHFGIGFEDDEYHSIIRSKEQILREFELNLTTGVRAPFYEHGLTDTTIERFRLGYQPEHIEERDNRSVLIPNRYVIPYLEGRRPKYFRYYDPNPATNRDGKYKYTWETDAELSLFNAGDVMGDANGHVFICEGEQKAMLLAQLGYAAVAVPGASQWREEWQGQFSHARKIFVCYDNDRPEAHRYDKPEEGRFCQKCRSRGFSACIGHNPGQEAAAKRVDDLGWRAHNVELPLPDDPAVTKTDINDFFMRDGYTNGDFNELATGKRKTPYIVQSFAEIRANPPEEATFIIEQGILPQGGRLLVAGKPKVGKSLFINDMALALASGKRFLACGAFGGFGVRRPTRTLLLDRELSKRSLYERLDAMIANKPGYQAAEENLLIDHDNLIRFDQPNAYDILEQLILQNGAEVVILDTAYKFLNGDVESSSAVMKAFGVLDKLIHETGCSVVLTHHHKKAQGGSSKQNNDIADPDQVAGSFLWTGWPNGTILLNYLNRSVENPFNSVATFTAFRDAAPPEPVALYRDRDSVAYRAIEPYSHEGSGENPTWKPSVTKPTTELVENLLLEAAPCTEEDFLHMAAGSFGVSLNVLKPYFVDVMSRGAFERTTGKPAIIRFKADAHDVETWEAEHGLVEKKMPDNIGAGLDDSMFDFGGVPT